MQDVSGVYTSLFLDTDQLKMALRARKVSGTFEIREPRLSLLFVLVLLRGLGVGGFLRVLQFSSLHKNQQLQIAV